MNASAEGLSGPSSSDADLTPGDGLTNPQFRSDFPRKAAPAWFRWKDELAEQGLRFNIDYLFLGQISDADTNPDSVRGGILRFYGAWQATKHGSLTFKIEDRHAFGSVAPQDFGLSNGALAISGTAFSDSSLLLTNLFWTQRDPEGRWTLQFGQIDVTDFLDIYGLVSPFTAFQNLAFNTNPTINAPNAGLGIAAGVRLGSNFYAVASIADADADPNDPNFDVFQDGRLFKSIEIGYTSDYDRIYFDNIHLTFWHSDSSDDGTRPSDKGVTASAAWFIANKWMPFLRAGWADGTAALYNRSVSVGLGYYSQRTDLAGLGLNWAEGNGTSGTQFTAELFYRFSISPGLQITPSIQFIDNPLLNPAESSITLLGLRARLVF
ncbi:MAG: carbohydrate porin [Pseudomonadota bacterium]